MDGTRLRIPTRLCLVLCGLMVTVPFLFPHHYFPFPSFYTEWLAFALGLAALVAMGVAPGARAVPVPAMSLGLLGLTAVLALQVAAGAVAYPLRSGMGALYTLWAALIVLLGAWLGAEAGERRVAHALQWWLGLAGAAVAASGFLQYYHTPLGLATIVAPKEALFMFGVIGQSNNFANYLGIALLSAACLHARGALGLAPAALVVLLTGSAMALSGSRTSWGYMAILLALAPFTFRSDVPGSGGRFLRLVLLGLAIFTMVQVLNMYTDVFTGPQGKPLSAGDRFVKYLDLGTGSAARPIRLQLFLYAWLMFLSHPVLGVGFGEYAWRSFELAADLPGVIPAGLDRHSHNLFLQLLAETGIAGFLCIAVPLAAWLLRGSWRNPSPERCWAIGVLAIIGLHSMVEFPLWHANFLGIFALLFGLLSPASATLHATRVRRGVFLGVLGAGWLTAASALSDYRYFEGWFLRLEAGGPNEIVQLRQLDSLLTKEKGSLFSPYFDRLLSEAMALDEHGLSTKIEFNSQVLRIYPVPSVVDRQIVLLALAGRDADAARLLRGAVRVYPAWMEVWMPSLEELARARPERLGGLLASARADLAVARSGRPFAPLAGKR